MYINIYVVGTRAIYFKSESFKDKEEKTAAAAFKPLNKLNKSIDQIIYIYNIYITLAI